MLRQRIFLASLLLMAASGLLFAASPGDAPAAAVFGEVVDESGDGVAGLAIELYADREGEVSVSSTRSGPGGRFVFEEVPPAEALWILVDCADICRGRPIEQVRLSQGSATRVTVRVRRSAANDRGSGGSGGSGDFARQLRTVRWVASGVQLAIAALFVAGLVWLSYRFRSSMTRGTFLARSAKIAVVLVLVPWSLLLLTWLAHAIAPASPVWLALLSPFVFYEAVAASITGTREWFGEWYMPTDWRGVAVVLGFYLALSVGIAAAMQAWGRRRGPG